MQPAASAAPATAAASAAPIPSEDAAAATAAATAAPPAPNKISLQAEEVVVLLERADLFGSAERALWHYSNLRSALPKKLWKTKDRLAIIAASGRMPSSSSSSSSSSEAPTASAKSEGAEELVSSASLPHHFTLRMAPTTRTFFVADKYRLCLALDMSPSMWALDAHNVSSIPFGEAYASMAAYLRGLVQPALATPLTLFIDWNSKVAALMTQRKARIAGLKGLISSLKHGVAHLRCELEAEREAASSSSWSSSSSPGDGMVGPGNEDGGMLSALAEQEKAEDAELPPVEVGVGDASSASSASPLSSPLLPEAPPLVMFSPQIQLTVVAQSARGSLATDKSASLSFAPSTPRLLSHGFSLTRESLPLLLDQLKSGLHSIEREEQLIQKRKRHQQAIEAAAALVSASSSSAENDSAAAPKQQPQNDHQHQHRHQQGHGWRASVAPLIESAVYALKLLPTEAVPSVVLITDCVGKLPRCRDYGSLVMQMGRHDISCSVLHAGTCSGVHTAFGSVPDTDGHSFLAQATGGYRVRQRDLDAFTSLPSAALDALKTASDLKLKWEQLTLQEEKPLLDQVEALRAERKELRRQLHGFLSGKGGSGSAVSKTDVQDENAASVPAPTSAAAAAVAAGGAAAAAAPIFSFDCWSPLQKATFVRSSFMTGLSSYSPYSSSMITSSSASTSTSLVAATTTQQPPSRPEDKAAEAPSSSSSTSASFRRHVSLADYAFPWKGPPPPLPMARTALARYRLPVDPRALIEVRLKEGFRVVSASASSAAAAASLAAASASSSTPRPAVSGALQMVLPWQPQVLILYGLEIVTVTKTTTTTIQPASAGSSSSSSAVVGSSKGAGADKKDDKKKKKIKEGKDEGERSKRRRRRKSEDEGDRLTEAGGPPGADDPLRKKDKKERRKKSRGGSTVAGTSLAGDGGLSLAEGQAGAGGGEDDGHGSALLTMKTKKRKQSKSSVADDRLTTTGDAATTTAGTTTATGEKKRKSRKASRDMDGAAAAVAAAAAGTSAATTVATTTTEQFVRVTVEVSCRPDFIRLFFQQQHLRQLQQQQQQQQLQSGAANTNTSTASISINNTSGSNSAALLGSRMFARMSAEAEDVQTAKALGSFLTVMRQVDGVLVHLCNQPQPHLHLQGTPTAAMAAATETLQQQSSAPQVNAGKTTRGGMSTTADVGLGLGLQLTEVDPTSAAASIATQLALTSSWSSISSSSSSSAAASLALASQQETGKEERRRSHHHHHHHRHHRHHHHSHERHSNSPSNGSRRGAGGNVSALAPAPALSSSLVLSLRGQLTKAVGGAYHAAVMEAARELLARLGKKESSSEVMAFLAPLLEGLHKRGAPASASSASASNDDAGAMMSGLTAERLLQVVAALRANELLEKRRQQAGAEDGRKRDAASTMTTTGALVRKGAVIPPRKVVASSSSAPGAADASRGGASTSVVSAADLAPGMSAALVLGARDPLVPVLRPAGLFLVPSSSLSLVLSRSPSSSSSLLHKNPVELLNQLRGEASRSAALLTTSLPSSNVPSDNPSACEWVLLPLPHSQGQGAGPEAEDDPSLLLSGPVSLHHSPLTTLTTTGEEGGEKPQRQMQDAIVLVPIPGAKGGDGEVVSALLASSFKEDAAAVAEASSVSRSGLMGLHRIQLPVLVKGSTAFTTGSSSASSEFSDISFVLPSSATGYAREEGTLTVVPVFRVSSPASPFSHLALVRAVLAERRLGAFLPLSASNKAATGEALRAFATFPSTSPSSELLLGDFPLAATTNNSSSALKKPSLLPTQLSLLYTPLASLSLSEWHRWFDVERLEVALELPRELATVPFGAQSRGEEEKEVAEAIASAPTAVRISPNEPLVEKICDWTQEQQGNGAGAGAAVLKEMQANWMACKTALASQILPNILPEAVLAALRDWSHAELPHARKVFSTTAAATTTTTTASSATTSTNSTSSSSSSAIGDVTFVKVLAPPFHPGFAALMGSGTTATEQKTERGAGDIDKWEDFAEQAEEALALPLWSLRVGDSDESQLFVGSRVTAPPSASTAAAIGEASPAAAVQTQVQVQAEAASAPNAASSGAQQPSAAVVAAAVAAPSSLHRSHHRLPTAGSKSVISTSGGSTVLASAIGAAGRSSIAVTTTTVKASSSEGSTAPSLAGAAVASSPAPAPASQLLPFVMVRAQIFGCKGHHGNTHESRVGSSIAIVHIATFACPPPIRAAVLSELSAALSAVKIPVMAPVVLESEVLASRLRSAPTTTQRPPAPQPPASLSKSHRARRASSSPSLSFDDRIEAVLQPADDDLMPSPSSSSARLPAPSSGEAAELVPSIAPLSASSPPPLSSASLSPSPSASSVNSSATGRLTKGSPREGVPSSSSASSVLVPGAVQRQSQPQLREGNVSSAASVASETSSATSEWRFNPATTAALGRQSSASSVVTTASGAAGSSSSRSGPRGTAAGAAAGSPVTAAALSRTQSHSAAAGAAATASGPSSAVFRRYGRASVAAAASSPAAAVASPLKTPAKQPSPQQQHQQHQLQQHQSSPALGNHHHHHHQQQHSLSARTRSSTAASGFVPTVPPTVADLAPSPAAALLAAETDVSVPPPPPPSSRHYASPAPPPVPVANAANKRKEDKEEVVAATLATLRIPVLVPVQARLRVANAPLVRLLVDTTTTADAVGQDCEIDERREVAAAAERGKSDDEGDNEDEEDRHFLSGESPSAAVLNSICCGGSSIPSSLLNSMLWHRRWRFDLAALRSPSSLSSGGHNNNNNSSSNNDNDNEPARRLFEGEASVVASSSSSSSSSSSDSSAMIMMMMMSRAALSALQDLVQSRLLSGLSSASSFPSLLDDWILSSWRFDKRSFASLTNAQQQTQHQHQHQPVVVARAHFVKSIQLSVPIPATPGTVYLASASSSSSSSPSSSASSAASPLVDVLLLPRSESSRTQSVTCLLQQEIRLVWQPYRYRVVEAAAGMDSEAGTAMSSSLEGGQEDVSASKRSSSSSSRGSEPHASEDDEDKDKVARPPAVAVWKTELRPSFEVRFWMEPQEGEVAVKPAASSNMTTAVLSAKGLYTALCNAIYARDAATLSQALLRSSGPRSSSGRSEDAAAAAVEVRVSAADAMNHVVLGGSGGNAANGTSGAVSSKASGRPSSSSSSTMMSSVVVLPGPRSLPQLPPFARLTMRPVAKTAATTAPLAPAAPAAPVGPMAPAARQSTNVVAAGTGVNSAVAVGPGLSLAPLSASAAEFLLSPPAVAICPLSLGDLGNAVAGSMGALANASFVAVRSCAGTAVASDEDATE